MMRIRGVWTTNRVAFLRGVVHRLSAIRQLPKRKGFGLGASVVVSSLYMLPAALSMGVNGAFAGRVAHRVGSNPR